MTTNNLTNYIYETMTRWIRSVYDNNLIGAKSQRYVYINNSIQFSVNVYQK